MSRLLFQGVNGEPDVSESLRINQNVCHPERRDTKWSEVEGPLFAFPFVPDPCSLSPGRVPVGDKLHEECGVVAIHNHM